MGSSSSSSKFSPARSKPSDFRNNAARLGPPSVKKPLFSRLPTEWLIILLSEWMDIKDVAKLDTAMTNHTYRAGFLQLLVSVRSTSVDGRYGPASFPKLQWLSLRRVYVESIEMDRLEIEQFQMLKLTTLRKLVLRDVDDLRIISATTINSPLLQSLDIDNRGERTNALTDCVFAHICSVCSALEHFRFSEYSLSAITARVLLSILRGCQKLKTVALNCRMLKNFTASEIESLQPFGQLFTALDFPDRHDYTSTSRSPPSVGRLKAFADLITQCPNLKKLVFSNSHNESYEHEGEDDSVLVNVGRFCPLIKEIELETTVRCPDAGLHLLSQNCVNVHTIALNYCHLTNASIVHISKIHSVHDLSIQNCDGGDGVTDEGLQSLFRGCPNLRNISISGENFSEEGFRELRNASCAKSLTYIYLWFENNELTQAFEVVMGESLACCQNLVTFSVRYYGDASFGNVGLALMCEGCPKLEDLTLLHDETLTMDGLMHAASMCPLLREITVDIITGGDDSSEGFSRKDLRKFNKRFPNIKLQEDYY